MEMIGTRKYIVNYVSILGFFFNFYAYKQWSNGHICYKQSFRGNKSNVAII